MCVTTLTFYAKTYSAAGHNWSRRCIWNPNRECCHHAHKQQWCWGSWMIMREGQERLQRVCKWVSEGGWRRYDWTRPLFWQWKSTWKMAQIAECVKSVTKMSMCMDVHIHEIYIWHFSLVWIHAASCSDPQSESLPPWTELKNNSHYVASVMFQSCNYLHVLGCHAGYISTLSKNNPAVLIVCLNNMWSQIPTPRPHPPKK